MGSPCSSEAESSGESATGDKAAGALLEELGVGVPLLGELGGVPAPESEA